MPFAEIVLPSTKPETEWVAGRALRKASPTRNHSRVRGRLLHLNLPWAEGRGEVGPEWRFRVQPRGGPRRPLVPGIAFVSSERLRELTDDEIQIPALAPTVAYEVLSAGTALVVVVDPDTRTIALHGGGEPHHTALPEFRMDVGAMFAAALERRH